MDHALIARVVQVDKIFLVVWVQSLGVNSIPMVLRRDVAATGSQVKSRDVVGTVAVLELNCAGACSHGEELVAETDTEDGKLVVLDDLLEVVCCSAAVSWVTGAVADEDPVEVLRDILEGVVERQDCDGRASGDEEVNGEQVKKSMEQWRLAELIRTGTTGLAFMMAVLGIWGDGAGPRHLMRL